MTLPMLTYEDQVGVRVKLIDYKRMAHIVERMVEDEPQQVQYVLQMWGDAIYKLGIGNPPAMHLKQPLKVVAS